MEVVSGDDRPTTPEHVASHQHVVGSAAAELKELEAATLRLLQPGSPFELHEEVVLGESMQVFKTRQRNFRELLEQSRNYGESEFLVFEDGTRVSFAEFHDLAVGAADVLQSGLGLSKGDRVAVCAQNGPGWILASSGARRWARSS